MAARAPANPSPEIAARSPVTTRPLVISLVGVCLLVAGAVIWAVFGRSPQTVHGPGIILPAGGYTEVGTTVVGIVGRVSVAPGDRVHRGDVVAVVRTPTARHHDVHSPVDGEIVDVLARPGRATGTGEPLATIQPEGGVLQAKSFVSAGPAELVEPGMAALVSPSDAPRSQYGLIVGSVVSVAPAPSTKIRLMTLLADNEELTKYFLDSGPVGEITIVMAAADNPSGYQWTVGDGPPQAVEAGTLAEVSVVLSDGSVIGRVTS